ncbi:MAG: hypothetical protein LC802_22410 [Acidobacteria bacterium]|nr:hypothetical protein [Acidobacteriota bacterium]
MNSRWRATLRKLLGLIERRHPDKVSDDASVYVILARKPPRDSAAVEETPGDRLSGRVEA